MTTTIKLRSKGNHCCYMTCGEDHYETWKRAQLWVYSEPGVIESDLIAEVMIDFNTFKMPWNQVSKFLIGFYSK